jgi:hypothetical protein
MKKSAGEKSTGETVPAIRGRSAKLHGRLQYGERIP